MCIHWSRDASCIHNESATKDGNEHADIAVWYIKTCDVVDRRTSESGNYYVERRKIFECIGSHSSLFHSKKEQEEEGGRERDDSSLEHFLRLRINTHEMEMCYASGINCSLLDARFLFRLQLPRPKRRWKATKEKCDSHTELRTQTLFSHTHIHNWHWIVEWNVCSMRMPSRY